MRPLVRDRLRAAEHGDLGGLLVAVGVGDDVQVRSYSVLKPGGRLVWVAPAPAGFKPSRSDVKVLRPAVSRDRAHLERIVALLNAGAVAPPPIVRYALADAAEAPWRTIPSIWPAKP